MKGAYPRFFRGRVGGVVRVEVDSLKVVGVVGVYCSSSLQAFLQLGGGYTTTGGDYHIA